MMAITHTRRPTGRVRSAMHFPLRRAPRAAVLSLDKMYTVCSRFAICSFVGVGTVLFRGAFEELRFPDSPLEQWGAGRVVPAADKPGRIGRATPQRAPCRERGSLLFASRPAMTNGQRLSGSAQGRGWPSPAMTNGQRLPDRRKDVDGRVRPTAVRADLAERAGNRCSAWRQGAFAVSGTRLRKPVLRHRPRQRTIQ